MTIWTPELERYPKGPRYRAIADALADDIAAGRLKPGDRLPTHRELAERLGLSLGTVTRAYLEAEERGLASGEVGRGTFVSGAQPEPTRELLGGAVDEATIDLSLLIPPVAAAELVASSLAGRIGEMVAEPDLMSVLHYQPHAGRSSHREAGADWLGRLGLEAPAEEVLLCGSGQHAGMVALSSLTKADDTVFTESLTSPLLKDLAAWLELRLQPLPMDADGLVPAAFEAACRTSSARVLYTMPTLHNPTGVTMPESRRREIAAVARSHDIAIVEGGVLGALVPDAPPPLTAFAPEHGCYYTSLSKVIAPGLRIGYLRVPPHRFDRAELAIRATMWMASPLMGEIAAGWIADGTADRIAAARRAEAEARLAVARRVLGDWPYDAAPYAYHLWLPLPEPWRSSDFVAMARQRGVAVTSPEAFVPGRGTAPHAVRVCLGAPASRRRLEDGLRVLADLLAGRHAPAVSVV